MIRASTLAAALALSLGTGVASANLLQNGDFEAQTLTGSGARFDTVNAVGNPNPDPFGALTSVTGWTVGGTSVDLIADGFNAIDGNSVDLAGTPGPGSLSQTFNAVAGLIYTLTWDYANNGGTVLLGSLGSIVDQTFTPTGSVQQGILSWTATTTGLATVSFSSGSGTGNGGPVIDNVVLTAVPEPSTYALMLAGLGFVGWMARKRKQGQGDSNADVQGLRLNAA